MSAVMTVSQIRQAFLNFFADKGHAIVPSSSLIPHNDPTLLFTNSGMVQFKDIFLGKESAPYNCATSSQRSLRAGGKHNDLENVGYTARHHTFFEMLGNFSFGAYFKQQAIEYAWELLTTVYLLPAEKLWVTVYAEDDEAYNIWHTHIKVPAQRIIRIGDNKGARYASDNFWQMGDTGPCGPCSEIFYDHGEDVYGGPPGSEQEDGDRYIEVWNLVFMQFNRDINGVLTALPKPCVDTGMGLERISAVLQHVHSNYEINLFKTLILKLADLTNCQDKQHNSLKVLADHLRAMTFLMLDGVMPSNEGRGYVLRRIMRRAIRHGYKLGMQESFIYKALPTLVELMGDTYSDLKVKANTITHLIKQEEERFLETLSRGMDMLELALSQLNADEKLSGELAFKLHDTYGFPLDLTADICREKNLLVDEQAFEANMQAQKERGRASSQFKQNHTIDYNGDLTEFLGYQQTHLNNIEISALYLAKSDEYTEISMVEAGQSIAIILKQTPFYAESGGQIGDSGLLSSDTGSIEVYTTQKLRENVFIHYGQCVKGVVNHTQQLQASVNHRQEIAKHHSATHLLHKVLRDILGEHVEQKGSLVEAHQLRFDFSNPNPISLETLTTIESAVNERIQANQLVVTELMNIEEAKQSGAMALFGEKYTEQVRVLTILDSKELCGGTHVKATGDIGLFKIKNESGIASGVRRIEAVCGKAALQYVQQQQSILQQLSGQFKTSSSDLVSKIEQQQTQYKQLQQSYQQKQSQYLNAISLTWKNQLKTINIAGINMQALVLLTNAEQIAHTELKLASDCVKQYLLHGYSYLISQDKINQQAHIVLTVMGDALQHMHAGKHLGELLKTVQGKGGGKPDMAQGSFSLSHLDSLLKAL